MHDHVAFVDVEDLFSTWVTCEAYTNRRGMLCRGRGSSADGQAENKVHGVHLRAPFRLRSADDLKYPFSNYVRGYTGLLDYVWYEPDQLEVQVSRSLCISTPNAFLTTTPCIWPETFLA